MYLSHETYLCVGVINADIHSYHEENSNGDTEITHQTANLKGKKKNEMKLKH